MFNNVFSENRAVYEIIWRITGRTKQVIVDNIMHAGYLRLQTHIQNMQYFLLVYCNDGCMIALHCYVIRTLPVLLDSEVFLVMFHTHNFSTDTNIYICLSFLTVHHTHTHTHTHTPTHPHPHTHTHTCVCIYIYIYLCVCVCVFSTVTFLVYLSEIDAMFEVGV